ncbi:MAG: YfiR family protein [Acidobacteriaceae bacterium]
MRPRRKRRAERGARRVRGWVTALTLATIAMAHADTPAERSVAERASSDQVEAAYLYNFGKFVRWPATASQGPMVLCVAGEDNVDQFLARMVEGEQIDGRPLQVKALGGADDAGRCSILFVGPGERERVGSYLGAASGKPVLTVGEAPDFLSRGGIIQFVLNDDHVRFSVNLNAAHRNSLQLSSELLKVAVSVTGEPQAGGLP